MLLRIIFVLWRLHELLVVSQLVVERLLPAIVVKDIFFLHERGWWMGVYMVFFQCLPSLFIVISGFVINGLGWRWHLWVTLSSH